MTPKLRLLQRTTRSHYRITAMPDTTQQTSETATTLDAGRLSQAIRKALPGEIGDYAAARSAAIVECYDAVPTSHVAAPQTPRATKGAKS